MGRSATSSSRFEFNYKPLLGKSGLRNRPPERLPHSWGLRSIAPFDFSPASDQPSIRPWPSSNQETPNLSLIETEPWTPPADAHPNIALHAFVEAAWRILEPAVPFVDSWHLGLLCGHLEAISTGRLLEANLLVNTPPGSSKSLIASVFWPAWEWTWAPWTRWLTSSYDDALALRDAVRTRTLMQSEWYRRQIAEPWLFSSDQNVKGYYTNDKTGWRVATSMGGGNTGWHCHRLVIDDPHSVKKAESDAVREATLAAWREVFPSRVLPGGVRVMVGQRTHEEDATADWLSREGQDIHHIELKMEHEAPRAATRHPEGHVLTEGDQSSPRHGAVCTLTGEPHDQRTHEGDLLIPERFPRVVIERRKIELGSYAYSSQFQQSPTPRAGALLNPAWFPQTPQLERSTVDLVAAFDLNYSDADTSDWTVGLLGAVERTPVLPRIHLVAGFAEHLSEERHVEHIGEWLCLWRPVLVGIEKRAFEREGATRDLCRQLLAYCEERGFSLSLEPIECDGDKISRAMIIPGRAKAGLITADKRAPFWTRLAKQMSQFPRSAHDDDVDALAHLVRLVVEKLERLRNLGGLLGKSAQVVVEDSVDDARPDWAKAAMAGLR
jgi:predicted phage terminase large subunit-like protein